MEYEPLRDCSVTSGSSEGSGWLDFFDFFRFREESSVGETADWSSSSTAFPFFRFLDLDLDSDVGSASVIAFMVSSFAGFCFRSFSDLSEAPALGVGSMAEREGSEVFVDDLLFLLLFFSLTSDPATVVPVTLEASAASRDGSVARTVELGSEVASEAFSFFLFLFSFLSPDGSASSSLSRFRFFFSFPSGLEGAGSGSTEVPESTGFFFVRALFTISGRVSAWSETSAIVSCFFLFSLRSNR